MIFSFFSFIFYEKQLRLSDFGDFYPDNKMLRMESISDDMRRETERERREIQRFKEEQGL